MKTVIEMAMQAGCTANEANAWGGFLKRFAELVRADERENGQKWFDSVTVQHKQAILAEREACAKVCDDIDTEYEGEDVLATWCAAAIRVRGQA